VAQVHLDGVGREEHLLGDLGVAEHRREIAEHRLLALCHLLHQAVVAGRSVGGSHGREQGQGEAGVRGAEEHHPFEQIAQPPGAGCEERRHQPLRRCVGQGVIEQREGLVVSA
jgi:hypothetical protein